MNTAEALKEVGFPVSKRSAFYCDDKAFYRDGIGKLVVREDTGKALAWVSDQYNLVPHDKALAPVLAPLDGIGFDILGTGSDAGGARVAVRARSKRSWNVGHLNGLQDEVHLDLLFINSYDRSSAIKVKMGGFRVLCSNGMAVSMPGFEQLNIQLSTPHRGTGIPEPLVNVAKSINRLVDAIDPEMDNFRKMAGVFLNFEEPKISQMVADILGTRAVDPVLTYALQGRGQDGRQTAWALYNGGTQYLTDRLGRARTQVASSVNLVNKAQQFLAGVRELASV